MSASKRAALALPQRWHDAMFAATPADVAQLVEQRFRKPQVTGSNPVVGSSFTRNNLESEGVTP